MQTYDVLEKMQLNYPCFDHGFVRIVDCMPRLVPLGITMDYAIAEAARMSTGRKEGKTFEDDVRLLRRLMRDHHTGPFEQVEFKFHLRLPIFVARQWLRHRTANVNEYSGRYSVLQDDFYTPEADQVLQQSSINKQGTGAKLDNATANEFLNNLHSVSASAYSKYKEALSKGIAKEQARWLLPVNIYTEWFWKIDLHNLLHFLALRCDKHAQREIRDPSNLMLNIISQLVPHTVEAWNNYNTFRDAIKLSSTEIKYINQVMANILKNFKTLAKLGADPYLNNDTGGKPDPSKDMTAAELMDFKEKLKRLGIV